jgi:hypothetical protein
LFNFSKIISISVFVLSFVGRFHEIEQVVMDWIRTLRAEGAMISGFAIRSKALTVGQELRYADFKASIGWLLRFLFRNKLVLRYARTKIINLCSSEFIYLNIEFFFIQDEYLTQAQNCRTTTSTLYSHFSSHAIAQYTTRSFLFRRFIALIRA